VAVALQATCALRTAKRLQMTRTLRRLGRLLFRFAGGLWWFVLRLLLLRCPRRRGRLRAASELGALFQPRLIILGRVHHERAFHSIMAEAAKLSANHFVGPGLDWREPDRNERTRDRIARDPHTGHKEIVDDIL